MGAGPTSSLSAILVMRSVDSPAFEITTETVVSSPSETVSKVTGLGLAVTCPRRFPVIGPSSFLPESSSLQPLKPRLTTSNKASDILLRRSNRAIIFSISAGRPALISCGQQLRAYFILSNLQTLAARQRYRPCRRGISVTGTPD